MNWLQVRALGEAGVVLDLRQVGHLSRIEGQIKLGEVIRKKLRHQLLQAGLHREVGASWETSI